MAIRLTARLEIFNSKPDVNGNRYWAFRFIDYATGKEVAAQTNGDNARLMLFDWHGKATGWARDIEVESTELGIRDFKRTTKAWPYAGCAEELRAFVKSKI